MLLNTDSSAHKQPNSLSLLYEDDLVLGIYKPAGVTVNRAESVKGETVQDWMEQRFSAVFEAYAFRKDEQARIFAERSGIAHRLDKDTSGVLLAAKTPEALRELMKQFKEREVKKTYIALVHGKLEPKKGNISLPIGRSIQVRGRYQLDPIGKKATTFYEAVAVYSQSDMLAQRTQNRYVSGFTLLRIRPITGRTHQIRVHMSALGYPLVGDLLYGRKRLIEADHLWCGRHFLHAWQIRVTHPSGNPLDIHAPLAEELKQALDRLMQEEGSDVFLHAT